jgi:hypothetical protein
VANTPVAQVGEAELCLIRQLVGKLVVAAIPSKFSVIGELFVTLICAFATGTVTMKHKTKESTNRQTLPHVNLKVDFLMILCLDLFFQFLAKSILPTEKFCSSKK